MKKMDLNETEFNSVRDILGYLNFSSGNFDPRFWAAWNVVFSFLTEDGSTVVWKDAYQTLADGLKKLSENSEAFRNAERASFYLDKVFNVVLPAYRQFHFDVLFYQTDEFLFNPFFIARVCEIVLSVEPPWLDEAKTVEAVLMQLNDYLGYRPVPVLEGREKHEPNPHEWIAPVPLYKKGVGVAVGPYRDVVEKCLEILRDTDPVLLRDAWFDPEKLDELVLDPRAYDFDHPVNRRPNYSFGTWDLNNVDVDGFYHRFVVHQVTLDGICRRVDSVVPLNQNGFAAAVDACLNSQDRSVAQSLPRQAEDSPKQPIGLGDSVNLANALANDPGETNKQPNKSPADSQPSPDSSADSQPSSDSVQSSEPSPRPTTDFESVPLETVPCDELLFEAGAVLAGTMLMGSGVTGDHFQTHDSSVTLATLMPLIASYRDRFYESLILKVPAKMSERLESEARRLFLPFGGARQNLNQRLAKCRADQLQRIQLARTYARMGFFEAAKRQTNVVAVVSARILCQIDCYVSQIIFLADEKKIDEAAAILPEIEDLLHRGIRCGAFPDPWSLLGFGAQFSLFPSVDNTIHDHRVDELIILLNDIFDIYSRLLKEAAAVGNFELQADLSEKMSDLAAWWDQYGSTEVSNIDGFSGQETWESAVKVATALAAWRQLGTADGDVAFWRRHVERFDSPKAFVLLGEALLERNDLVSSMALLMHWLSLSDEIPLAENDYSFHAIAFRWMEQLWRGKPGKTGVKAKDQSAAATACSPKEYAERWTQTKKFLDRLEANADAYWNVPELDVEPDMLDELNDSPPERPQYSFKNFSESAQKIFQVSAPSNSPDNIIDKDGKAVEPSKNIPFPEDLKSDLLKLFPNQKDELLEFFEENKTLDPELLVGIQFFKDLFEELKSHRKNGSKVDPNAIIEGFEKFGLLDGLETPDDEFNFVDFIDSFINASPDDDNDDDDEDADDVDDDDDDDDDGGFFDVEAILRKFKRLSSKNNDDDDDEDEFDEEDEIIQLDDDDEYAKFLFSDGDGDEEEEDVNAFLHEDDEDDDDIRGIDPLYQAAYENVTYRDSSEDGVEDEMLEGFSDASFFDDDDFELAQETDRINDRLAFIFTISKLWKYAGGKSPLLPTPNTKELSDEELADARERIERWLKQAVVFQKDLNVLLETTARYRIPKPKGTSDSLIEYDQRRGTKEILLDRIVWTIVETTDTILFLQAVLRQETLAGESRPWGAKVLQVMAAAFRSDAKKVKSLWKGMLTELERETLLYIPTSRGGNPKAIVSCRCLQQVVLRLFEYAPRLGLVTEAFRLLQSVQKMEQIRPSLPGAITEFDRIVEVATRSITECLVESAKNWRVRGNDPTFASVDQALVSYVERTMEILLSCWLSHSQRIRISSVETIMSDVRWESLKSFVQRYGSDIFTQHFLSFRNIRAILHQGVENYLRSLVKIEKESRELETCELLIDDLIGGRLEMQKAVEYLELVFECVAENYSEYIDYNSTSTYSDHGEKIYMLLDMLRVLINYERISWNLKPVYWIHDSMVRLERMEAASLWESVITKKSENISVVNIQNYLKLSNQYGIWIPSIYERLQERFIRPLQVARMCGFVSPAIQEARTGEPGPAFEALEKQVEEFAKTPMGVGFDVPDWLNDLQDEVSSIQAAQLSPSDELSQEGDRESAFNPPPIFDRICLNRSDLERQLEYCNEFIHFVEP